MSAAAGTAGRRTLVALIPLAIANHAVLAGNRVTVSLDAIARGASPFTVGVLMSLYAVFPMLLAISTGRITDRLGARRPMVLGTAAIGIGALLPLILSGMPALYASASMVGVGFMAFQVAAQNAAGELGAPAQRSRNFSLLAMGFSISGFAGPLAAGLAIDHYGFTVTFALLAVVPFVPLVVLMRGHLALPGPVAATGAPHLGGIRALMRHRMLRRALLLNAFFAVGWDLHSVFVPIYGARLGLSASAIGLVLAAFAAATFVVRLLIPALALRTTEHRILAGALIAAGGAYLAYPFADRLATLLPLSFGLGLALGAGQPMIMALLHTHAPPGRMGEAGGVRMSLINSMSFAVPIAFGAVGAAVGLAPVFWTVGACLAVAGVAARREVRT
jgi:MFS family permease